MTVSNTHKNQEGATTLSLESSASGPELQYKTLFDNNPLPCWIYNSISLDFLEVNEAALRHYGYTKEEFLQLNVYSLHPPEQVALLEKRLVKEKLETHLSFTNWKHKKKNGEIFYVDLNINKIEYKGCKATIVVINDVTSRLKAENELKRTNELFALASTATSDAIWDLNLITDELIWADGLTTLFGYKKEEVPYDRWLSLIHPNDKEEVEGSLNRAIYDGSANSWTCEYRFETASGKYKYVLNRGFILRDEHKKPYRMIGSMQDISDKHYEHKINELELKVFEISSTPGIQINTILTTLLIGFEQLHENIFASFAYYNINGELEFLSPRILPSERKNLLELVKKQADKRIKSQNNLIVSNVENEEWNDYVDLSEKYKWKVSWTIPIIQQTGETLGYFSVYLSEERNPSEQEQAMLSRLKNLLLLLVANYISHEKVRQSNERYNIVLQATHDLVWDWNLETGSFYRNEAGVKKVYGVENEETIRNIFNWMQHVHPEDQDYVQQVVNDILTSNEKNTFDVEYRFRRDDGNYSHIYDRGIILRNAEGKSYRMIGAAQDISERKKLEQELLENELEAQKIISQATINTQEQERGEIGKELHDNVNQVLTTTKLYLDLSLSNPDMKDELIEKSVKNIICVINEIRQLSRSLMDPSLGDLGLVDSINDLIENINLTRRLKVVLRADHTLNKELAQQKRLMIFRIVQEALNNAIKHAKASEVQIDLKKNGEMVNLNIADDGVGFNTFEVKKGSGLNNIQNRVYLTNGKLSISSEPGSGCKMEIQFPIN